MQPEDINKVTELTQQLIQAPINNLALFIAVLALFVLLGSLYIAYRLSPRIVKFLESLTASYSKMVDNLEKLTVVESQNSTMQASVNDAIGGINNNVNVLLTEGSTPVKRIDTNVVTAIEKIDEAKDIAIATADLANTSQEAILHALIEAVKEIKAAINKRRTGDSQPVVTIPAENGETKDKAA